MFGVVNVVHPIKKLRISGRRAAGIICCASIVMFIVSIAIPPLGMAKFYNSINTESSNQRYEERLDRRFASPLGPQAIYHHWELHVRMTVAEVNGVVDCKPEGFTYPEADLFREIENKKIRISDSQYQNLLNKAAAYGIVESCWIKYQTERGRVYFFGGKVYAIHITRELPTIGIPTDMLNMDSESGGDLSDSGGIYDNDLRKLHKIITSIDSELEESYGIAFEKKLSVRSENELDIDLSEDGSKNMWRWGGYENIDYFEYLYLDYGSSTTYVLALKWLCSKSMTDIVIAELRAPYKTVTRTWNESYYLGNLEILYVDCLEEDDITLALENRYNELKAKYENMRSAKIN